MLGKVVNIQGKRTAFVEVERYRVHPVYEKRVKRTRRFAVDNLAGAEIGDNVEFVACAPLSATKRWKIIKSIKTENRKIEKQKK